MTQTKNNLSAFHWQGKSQVINQWGRIETQREILLKANRVNAESNIAKSYQTNSEKAPR
jgi:hypothetical protein